MSVTTLRSGDRIPAFKRTITSGGDVVNLTGATDVLFKVADPVSGTTLVSGSADITSALEGKVSYELTDTDVLDLPVGSYFFWYEVDFSGKTLTAPNNEPETLIITDATNSRFSYTGDPSSRNLDAIRFYIGDTDESDYFLYDGEIEFLLATWLDKTNSLLYVASLAADAIAAKLAREVSYSADGVSVSTDQLQTKFQTLAEQLREQYKKEVSIGAAVFFTSDFWEMNYDPAIKPLSFGIGMHDNPEGGPQTSFAPNSSSWYNYYYGF